MFNVNIYIKNDKILGEFLVDSYFFEPNKYDYAFYLYKNNERVDATSYSKSMKVCFELKDMTGVFSIKAYIRDIEQGNKRSYYSEEISIDI